METVTAGRDRQLPGPSAGRIDALSREALRRDLLPVVSSVRPAVRLV